MYFWRNEKTKRKREFRKKYIPTQKIHKINVDQIVIRSVCDLPLKKEYMPTPKAFFKFVILVK